MACLKPKDYETVCVACMHAFESIVINTIICQFHENFSSFNWEIGHWKI